MRILPFLLSLSESFGLAHFSGLVQAAEPKAGLEKIEFKGALYHVYRVPRVAASGLELLWLGADGKPLGSFTGLQSYLAAQKKQIVFATNAGIYESGPKPCGLTICATKELVPLSLSPGEGNFYLKPNGVFYVDEKKGAGVMEAAEFGTAGLQPRLATQSGPLLLRRGVMHSAFTANSVNFRQRSAVGVRASDGQIIFVMSDRESRSMGRVTFHQLASLFTYLGCDDALYLDGEISQMLVKPRPDAKFPPNTFAAMFVIAK